MLKKATGVRIVAALIWTRLKLIVFNIFCKTLIQKIQLRTKGQDEFLNLFLKLSLFIHNYP